VGGLPLEVSAGVVRGEKKVEMEAERAWERG